MNSLYVFCIVFGSTMSLIQILMGSFGMVHHSINLAHFGDYLGLPTTNDHHESENNQPINLLSIRAMSSAITFFGFGGGLVQLLSGDTTISIFTGLVCGYLGAYLTAWAISKLITFDDNGTIHLTNAIGAKGRAITSMNPNESGMALILIGGRKLKMSAINKCGARLLEGDSLIVSEMQGTIALVVSQSISPI